MKRSRKAALIVVVLAAAGGGAYFVFSKDRSAAPRGRKTVKVGREDLAGVVLATGKIEPYSKVELKSRASGVVERLLVDEADAVKTGQVVAELDKSILQARVREAKGSLDAARAELEKAQIEA